MLSRKMSQGSQAHFPTRTLAKKMAAGGKATKPQVEVLDRQ